MRGTQFEIKINPFRQAQERSNSFHRESVGKALSSPGIRSNKKTHINGGSSVRMAGIVCANENQIRRQGRWNDTTMTSAYLTSLPREMLRSMAESPPPNGRSFYLARTALDPPTASARKLSLDNLIQPTVAANAFVPVIMMLRKSFIQHSVLMMEVHPFHPIWQHAIFSDPAYFSLEWDLLHIKAQEHDPAHTLLQQCAPLHSRFQTPIGP
ncbi:hypothetical protein [Absidia glauca]|uniref:Ndc10 domain-containing protein n=1 Tax=Absidia glauca TaxID=4829 RepID=A0A168MJD6_ABSGL|nr:hypothetical protein [Absidia glauca]